MGDDNWSRMSKFVSEETIEAVCTSLKLLSTSQDKLFSIVLHGGEPLLVGAQRLEKILASLRTVLPASYPISIQTNGILINKEVLDICSRYAASVAVSIDGPRTLHDKLRVGHHGEGTFDAVMKGIENLKTHRDGSFLNAGLLAVIDPTSDPGEVYSFFKEIGAPSVDFLYKDGNHDRLPLGKSSLGSWEYGLWMTGLLQAYLDDPDPLPIRVIDDMLKVILGGIVSKEGVGVTDFGIIIIDTDGTIMKNDTLKSSYNGADKFDIPANIKDGTLLSFLRSETFLNYKEQQRPSSLKCLACPELNICGGGMILHRWKTGSGFNNPSVYCADQLYLINAMRLALSEISKKYA